MSFALETRPIAVCLLLLVATLVAAVYAMTLGRVPVPFVDVIGAVLGNGEGGMRQQIVFNLRLPRVLVALFAGASLGVSGAVFQSVSRNALGSPTLSVLPPALRRARWHRS